MEPQQCAKKIKIDTTEKSSFLKRKRELLTALNKTRNKKFMPELKEQIDEYNDGKKIFKQIFKNDKQLLDDIEIAQEFVSICCETYFKLPEIMQGMDSIIDLTLSGLGHVAFINNFYERQNIGVDNIPLNKNLIKNNKYLMKFNENTIESMQQMLCLHVNSYHYLSEELQNNEKFMLLMIEKNPKIITKMQHTSIEFILEAIKVNVGVYHYLNSSLKVNNVIINCVTAKLLNTPKIDLVSKIDNVITDNWLHKEKEV